MFYEHKGMASQSFQLQTLLHLLHRKLFVIEKQASTKKENRSNGVFLHVPYEFASISMVYVNQAKWYVRIRRHTNK